MVDCTKLSVQAPNGFFVPNFGRFYRFLSGQYGRGDGKPLDFGVFSGFPFVLSGFEFDLAR